MPGGEPLYHRVLLKLSGDAFSSHETGFGISPEATADLARQLTDVSQELGVQMAVVVGGGNIWRGRQAPAMDRARADYMGMLATVINALALQDALEGAGQATRVQTAIQMAQIAEPYIPLRAVRHLEKGRVVIFAAGLGVPIALEIHADAILKGTKVDGIYDADPVQHPGAHKFETIEYTEILTRGLEVMDATAISLCRDNNLPILVFDFRKDGNIGRVLSGEPIGTLVHGAAR